MIDLTQGLPIAIIGDDGEPILLNTDYRIWIKFGKAIEDDTQYKDLSYIFKGNSPIITKNIWEQLKLFYFNPSVTPKSDGSDSDTISDYLLDGDYIYSALYAVYGIDIIDTNMHWHKFQALCNNIIGDQTLWGYAKQVRGYTKPSKNDTIDKQYLRAKSAWQLPIEYTEEEKEKIREFEEYFS